MPTSTASTTSVSATALPRPTSTASASTPMTCTESSVGSPLPLHSPLPHGYTDSDEQLARGEDLTVSHPNWHPEPSIASPVGLKGLGSPGSLYDLDNLRSLPSTPAEPLDLHSDSDSDSSMAGALQCCRYRVAFASASAEADGTSRFDRSWSVDSLSSLRATEHGVRMCDPCHVAFSQDAVRTEAYRGSSSDLEADRGSCSEKESYDGDTDVAGKDTGVAVVSPGHMRIEHKWDSEMQEGSCPTGEMADDEADDDTTVDTETDNEGDDDDATLDGQTDEEGLSTARRSLARPSATRRRWFETQKTAGLDIAELHP